MSLFGSNKLSYLGVDLGNAGIKIVELKNENGRPRLVTYGFVDMSTEVINYSTDAMEDMVAQLINQICAQAGTGTKKTISSLPSFSVFSSVISLPEMKKNELDQAIMWEAKKFLPLPIEEMSLDWKIIDRQEVKKNGSNHDNKNTTGPFGDKQPEKNKSEDPLTNSKIHLKILLTASPKKNVNRYVNIFKKAGLDLIGLETESFALERSLIGFEESPTMVVDIGAITSDLTIIEKGIPVLNRSVDSGGMAITQTVARSLNITLKRAEQFKRDIGFSNTGAQSIPKVLENAIEPIINDIKYCFDLFSSREEKGKKVEKIILTGGSAFLPNISNFLSNLLNIKVVIGDPWARVIYPVELKPVLDELGPRFAVAVGLAMREIE